MEIKFGILDVSTIKVGALTVSKIYQGSNLVYPMDTTPPSVPTDLISNSHTPNIVSWVASTDDVTAQGNIEYFLERADDAGFTLNVTTITNWEKLLTDLDDYTPILVLGNTYSYRIKARDEALNESAWSTTYTTTIVV